MDRSLERNVDSAKSTIDDLVAEIESLEHRLAKADEEINRLEDVIDELNSRD
jgi:peptidoglycan hydrolase CwlO-like protein